ncbi:elongation factor P 5-aminopentanone reductase [Virgibacillus sp. W0181]|uniref:elongation factor P 5-aminopentanone reductase n=1 Tax=Virgibacillus sp. W0181 TaxID=3391581 RepID=UPI003F482849
MGKNVLIIGASGDIGIAIAKQLAAEGYTLLLHYHKNRQPIDQLMDGIDQEQIIAVMQADLSQENDIKAFVTKIVFPVDSIVFVSGKVNFGLFQDASIEAMNDMLTLHVKAPWIITKHLLPPMIQECYGKIIFITSIWASDGASNEVMYSSVKGAQNSFVKALAKEVARSGISVNGISPGFIDTKMNAHLTEKDRDVIIDSIPVNRPGLAEEVAYTVLFLLSDKAAYIQGEVIRVSGGW